MAGIAPAQPHRAYGDAIEAALSALVSNSKYDLNLPHIAARRDWGRRCTPLARS